MKKNMFLLTMCAVLCMAFAACDDDTEKSDKRAANPYVPVLNGKMYYWGSSADTEATAGWELWATDGTAEGTALVKDINTVAGEGSYPIILAVYNGRVYFSAYNQTTGEELWKTDGTEAGTVMVKNINEEAVPGTGENSNPEGLIIYNGKMYFSADDGTNGSELWVSDGTDDGTVMVKNINEEAGESSSPYNLTVFDGKLFFSATDGINGTELWVSDGTDDGTTLVKNINEEAIPGTGESSYPSYLTVFDGKLFFSANNGINGTELWVSDGTDDGTTLVKNINEEAIPGTGESSYPSYLTVFDGKLFFSATDGINGTELWVSDGTDTGTLMLEINDSDNSSPYGFMEFSGNLYFSANNGTAGAELWVSDGTADGTDMVTNINDADSEGSSPEYLTEYDGKLFFSATDGINGTELWVSDGIVDGTTQMLADLYPGGSSDPRYWYPAGSFVINRFILCNNLMLFCVDNGSDYVLARSDGTPEGTEAFTDLYLRLPKI